MEDYIPKIAKKDLVHGKYYKGKCRNATIARWHGEQGVFVHWRTKWGDRFTETIKHPEDESYYDVFVVESELEEVPENEEIHSFMDFINSGYVTITW